MKRDKVLLALPLVASAIRLAALGVLAVSEGSAQAAEGAGVLSGNAVQTPIHVPVNQWGTPRTSSER